MDSDTVAQRKALVEGAQLLSVPLDDEKVDHLMDFAAMLAERNRVMNLTRVPPGETVSRHFLDALTVARHMPAASGARVVDIGTGAGVPGLVLAVALPGLSFTLVDATRKKVTFVSDVAAALGLANVEAVHGRAEEMVHDRRYSSRFDAGTARAVSALKNLAVWGGPLIKPGGYLIAMKSSGISEELLEAREYAETARLALVDVDEVAVPVSGEVRKLVIWRRCGGAEREALMAARVRYGAKC